MYPSTEDLLKIRDSKPVDARAFAAVNADPELWAEIKRLAEVKDALQALPMLKPPSEAWVKIAAASESHPVPSSHWLLRGAIAATAALAAILLVMSSSEAPQTPLPSTTVAEVIGPGESGWNIARGLATPTYTSLVAESARLERQLNEIGYKPRLIRAGTATTITGLEDQISLIDAQLMYSRVNGLQPGQAEELQRTRVDLMNALLKVHHAHAQRFGF